MKKYFIILIIIFFFQNNLNAAVEDNIIEKLDRIKNITFNFIQTINGKDEKGKCTILYPKKIFCEYEKRNKKILVSNGSSVVIKKGQQFFRYPIESTPFEFLLAPTFTPNIPSNDLVLKFLISRSTPPLLKPNLLIIEFSLKFLNTLGFGFAYCGIGVTVPTSRKPNPKAPKQSM